MNKNKRIKPRNPVAMALTTKRNSVVKAKKGKGSYSRKGKRDY